MIPLFMAFVAHNRGILGILYLAIFLLQNHKLQDVDR